MGTPAHRIRWATATLLAVALAASACSSDRPSSSQTQNDGDTAATADAFPGITPAITAKDALAQADATEEHLAYAPAVPAAITRTDQRRWEVALEVVEGVCPLDPANDVTTLMWGYRVAGDTTVTCGSPGPVLRGRVGDVARITLTNLAGNEQPHNIDFHAVTGQGGGAKDLTVAPGETASIEIRLLYPGAFMYHCAFGDVPQHIAHGMYGMFIVDPETPLPAADHEWAVMQSEWYVTTADATGLAAYDRDALVAEEPRYVTFNGRTDALAGDNALTMAVGERARIYMVNEGLNLDSNFHPIGSHWDAVWAEAATHESNAPIRGSQSTLVVAGGGTVADIVAFVPETIILVDHALVRTFYKGAIGLIVVTGDADPELYVGEPVGGTPEPEPEPTEQEPVAGDTVVMPAGAFDPGNAATAFTPSTLTVAAGTTVTWVNEDQVFHTVTSGTSDGTAGQPDGRFDSGNIDAGQTWSSTFDEPGTFTYFCTPHPWMRGTVVVQ